MALGTTLTSLGSTHSSATTSATQTHTTTGAVPSGATAVAVIFSNTASRVLTGVADNQGNTWTIDRSQLGTANVYIASVYCPSGLTSGAIITATWASSLSSVRAIHAGYFTGQGVADQSTGSTGSTAAWSTGATSATSASAFAVGGCRIGQPTTNSNQTGSNPAFTELLDTTGSNQTEVSTYAGSISASTAVTAAGTWANSGTWAAAVVAYREAGTVILAGAIGASSTTAGALTGSTIDLAGTVAASSTATATLTNMASGINALAGTIAPVSTIVALLDVAPDEAASNTPGRGWMLEAQICDIWGEPLAGATIHHTSDGGGLQVIDPLNDSRTAQLTLSLYDPACVHARPLDRILSVTYGPHLIFKGPIIQPSVDFEAGTVTIYAHDPTIRLKHHYHRYGDEAVEEGVPIDGTGMRTLVSSSDPTAPQAARDTPSAGILWGRDTSTAQGPKPEDPNDPEPGDGIWITPTRGQNVWETITGLAGALIGPDFRFRPVDRDHPGKNGVPDPGYFCELDTADVLGSDRSDRIYFEHNLGKDNASNVIWEPDGDLVRNWFAVVHPGGERSSADVNRKAVIQANDAMSDYGIYQGWESSGTEGDSLEVLTEKAKAWVTAYRRPPNFVTVTPRIDRGQGVFDYGTNYKVGDIVAIRARKGHRECELLGRIISATIASVDQAGNTQVTLECVPPIAGDLDPED